VADYFPAFLDLRGRRCLIAGGGPVAERKALALLDSGAHVVVVAPALTPALAVLARTGVLEHRPRTFRKSDLRGCTVAIAATAVDEVDAIVADVGRRRGVLVNVVDRPALCDFIFPSVVRRGALQIAVSTSGRSPALAREVRKKVESLIGPEYETLVERVGAARRQARGLARTQAERLAAGEGVLALARPTLA
jgi:siroheme synthase-like protein